jgi:TolB-like protein
MYEISTGKKPFSGKNSLMTLDAVLHEKPVPPGELNPKVPVELEGIIGKAMEKDRKERYQSATQMKADLQQLKRENESGQMRSGLHSAKLRIASKTFGRTGSRWQFWLLLGSLAMLATVLAAVGAYWLKHREVANAEQKNAIAVLPLQNMNGDFTVDYLRFALADELTSVLSYSRSLEVRPSSVTRRYVEQELDPHKIGQELHVGRLLTGHFMRQGEQLTVTLEAIDVGSDRLLWQGSATASVNDLISMQSQLSTQVQQGLLPALGVAAGTLSAASRPKSQEAYDLYLHSLALPHDPAPNKDAIAVLEHVVGEDPSYAPGWEALGLRYYYDSVYGGGGEAMFQRSNSAYERALALDPNRVMAASNLITARVERGELGRAYDAATDLVRRRPQSGDAHFALSYVLRYAGMQEHATQECNTARSLDPGNFNFRSCAWAFMELGQTERAMDFVHLDAGSEWAAWATPYVYLTAGNVAQAREAVKSVAKSPTYHRDLLIACTQAQRPADMDRIVREEESSVMTEPDPEEWYHVGALMAYCGQKEAALRLLKAAVQQNYCAYSALLEDPLLKDLRKETAFNEVLTAASTCQETLKEGRVQ